MRIIASVSLLAALLFGCACTHHFPDENAKDVYRKIDYSKDMRIHNEVCPQLEFVEITESAVVVMRYTSNRPHLVRAGVGEYLRDETGCIAYRVVAVDRARGVAVIEYLFSTTYPLI